MIAPFPSTICVRGLPRIVQVPDETFVAVMCA